MYVGDSSTGLCRGITPFDTSYGGIAIGLGSIVPFDANAPTAQNLTAFIQAFLVDPAKAPQRQPAKQPFQRRRRTDWHDCPAADF